MVETGVGDRYVLEAMRAGGFVLGGEQTGHVILAEHATTGDGVLTALHLLARVAADRPLAGRARRRRARAAAGAGQRARRRHGTRAGSDPSRWPPRCVEAEAELGRDRPGAAAPVGHRAARARHGRGRHAGAGRPRWPSASPTSSAARWAEPALGGVAGALQRPRVTARAEVGARRRTGIPSRACAESSGTSGRSRRCRSWSTGCAGSSTAATTPRASPSCPTGCSTRARRRASSPTSRRCSAPTRCRSRPSASATPAGPRTAARPTPTRTRTSARTARSPSSTTASSRTSPSCAPSSPSRRRHALVRDRHRGRRAPARRGAADRGQRPRRGACAWSAAGSPVPSRSSPCTPTSPTSSSGARRNSPLVVGRGEGENFLASDVAAFIAHTRNAIELGQDQVVELRRDGVVVTDLRRRARRRRSSTRSRGTPPPPRRAATTRSWPRRSPSSPRRWPTRCSAASARTAGCKLDEMRLTEADLREVDKVVVIACGTAYHAGMVAKYALEHWTRVPVRGRARQRVPLPRPGRRPAHARRRDLAVRRDDGHPHGAALRARAGREGARDLQHAGLDDPARVRRGALHLRRPRGRGRVDQGVPHADRRVLPRRAVRRAGARQQVRRRDRSPSCASCRTCRRRSTSSSTRPRR